MSGDDKSEKKEKAPGTTQPVPSPPPDLIIDIYAPNKGKPPPKTNGDGRAH